MTGSASSPCRVVVTGPESTGKTTLAQRLANHFGITSIPEASRVYAERVSRDLIVDDVEPIAREHVTMVSGAEELARNNGNALLVLDTDLMSTIVYARHYYDLTVPWINEQADIRRGDLYLMCDIDVPWIPDGIRDMPDDRPQLANLFHEVLRGRNASSVMVRGDWDERWHTALNATQQLLV